MTLQTRPAHPGIILTAILAGMLGLGGGLLAPLHAQSYSIDWHQIGGSHGASTNGQFGLTGTVGAPDAHGTIRGGNYSVTGGFWSFISAVPTPGAPELAITLSSPQTVVISWPAPSTGFILQHNSTLNPAAWVDASEPIVSTPELNQIEATFIAGNRFYRLIQR
jgi:hypothetical protein